VNRNDLYNRGNIGGFFSRSHEKRRPAKKVGREKKKKNRPPPTGKGDSLRGSFRTGGGSEVVQEKIKLILEGGRMKRACKKGTRGRGKFYRINELIAPLRQSSGERQKQSG